MLTDDDEGASGAHVQDRLAAGPHGSSSIRSTTPVEAAWTPESLAYECNQRLECTLDMTGRAPHAQASIARALPAQVPSPPANIESVASMCVDWVSNTERNWHQVSRQMKTAVCEERKKIRNAIVDHIRGDISSPNGPRLRELPAPVPRVFMSPARNRALPDSSSTSPQARASRQEITLNTTCLSSSTSTDSCSDSPPTHPHVQTPMVLTQHISEVVGEAGEESAEEGKEADAGGRLSKSKPVARRLQVEQDADVPPSPLQMQAGPCLVEAVRDPAQDGAQGGETEDPSILVITKASLQTPTALRFDDSWWLSQLTERDIDAISGRVKQKAAAKAAAEFSEELRAPCPLEDEEIIDVTEGGEEEQGLPHRGQAVPDSDSGSPTGGAGSGGSNLDPIEPHPHSVKLGEKLFALVWQPSGPGPARGAREGKCKGACEEQEGVAAEASTDAARALASGTRGPGDGGPGDGGTGSSEAELKEGAQMEQEPEASSGQLDSTSPRSPHRADSQADQHVVVELQSGGADFVAF
eukprot:Tamp_07683.p1 GENE.Tamp_07683~~Tamp_07683.p1  ORF type:complete len:526 (-),score=65.49 Tamp_07683:545-2122(-)